ncbi:hypothetical protein AGMMS50293_21700 [Spirochaetia bacterium]|nr:hypothetical protein AGMMS50293_21700 [Spirochaetia bacterium]
MDGSSLVKLNLLAPLLYAEAPDLAPFAYAAAGTNAAGGAPGANTADPHEEQLFCFELDPAQYRSIEPDPKRLLGDLIFAGRSTDGASAKSAAAGPQLPAGLYLFAQQREALGREECIDLAVEQQKDGLWERFRPENRLYVRYLFEDGKAVTQIFRPVPHIHD